MIERKIKHISDLSEEITDAVLKGSKESSSKERWSMYTIYLNLSSGKIIYLVHEMNDEPYFHQPWIVKLLRPYSTDIDVIIEELIKSAEYLLERDGWIILQEWEVQS